MEISKYDFSTVGSNIVRTLVVPVVELLWIAAVFGLLIDQNRIIHSFLANYNLNAGFIETMYGELDRFGLSSIVSLSVVIVLLALAYMAKQLLVWIGHLAPVHYMAKPTGILFRAMDARSYAKIRSHLKGFDIFDGVEEMDNHLDLFVESANRDTSGELLNGSKFLHSRRDELYQRSLFLKGSVYLQVFLILGNFACGHTSPDSIYLEGSLLLFSVLLFFMSFSKYIKMYIKYSTQKIRAFLVENRVAEKESAPTESQKRKWEQQYHEAISIREDSLLGYSFTIRRRCDAISIEMLLAPIKQTFASLNKLFRLRPPDLASSKSRRGSSKAQ